MITAASFSIAATSPLAAAVVGLDAFQAPRRIRTAALERSRRRACSARDGTALRGAAARAHVARRVCRPRLTNTGTAPARVERHRALRRAARIAWRHARSTAKASRC